MCEKPMAGRFIGSLCSGYPRDKPLPRTMVPKADHENLLRRVWDRKSYALAETRFRKYRKCPFLWSDSSNHSKSVKPTDDKKRACIEYSKDYQSAQSHGTTRLGSPSPEQTRIVRFFPVQVVKPCDRIEVRWHQIQPSQWKLDNSVLQADKKTDLHREEVLPSHLTDAFKKWLEIRSALNPDSNLKTTMSKLHFHLDRASRR